MLRLKKQNKKNKTKANKPQFNVQRSFQCFDMSCISYKIPKQSPYTPWQYKCSHNGKNKIKYILNVKCHHSGVTKNPNNLGNGWTSIKTEHLDQHINT